jgi:hypothetical protein
VCTREQRSGIFGEGGCGRLEHSGGVNQHMQHTLDSEDVLFWRREIQEVRAERRSAHVSFSEQEGAGGQRKMEG